MKAVDADWLKKKTMKLTYDESRKKTIRKNLVCDTQGYNQK